MSDAPRFRRRRGHAAIVLLCLVALAYFFSEDRARRGRATRQEALACYLRREAIDRAVSAWESKNGRLPADRALWFDLDDRGVVTYASHNLTDWCERMRFPPAQRLVQGSEALPRGTRASGGWDCPRYTGKKGFPRGEVYYRFVIDPRGIATPSSRWHTRGVLCLMHGESGPPGDPDAVHALDR